MLRVVRAFATALVIAAPASAAADGNGYLFFGGGISIPVGDSTWNQSAEPGPTIKAGAAMHRGFGAMATLELTDVHVSSFANVYPIYAENPTLRRLRVLAHAIYEAPNALESGFALTVHAGVGLDRVYSHYEQVIAGSTFGYDATFNGYAFELGADVWFDLATGIDLGAQLSIPIAAHSATRGSGDPIGFNYTSYDLALLAAVRFTSGD
jgi:hypothetical protein